jgi:hypothetical protein
MTQTTLFSYYRHSTHNRWSKNQLILKDYMSQQWKTCFWVCVKPIAALDKTEGMAMDGVPNTTEKKTGFMQKIRWKINKNQILHWTSLHHPPTVTFWKNLVVWTRYESCGISSELHELNHCQFQSWKLMLSMATCTIQKSTGWIVLQCSNTFVTLSLESEMFMNNKGKLVAELADKCLLAWNFYDIISAIL